MREQVEAEARQHAQPKHASQQREQQHRRQPLLLQPQQPQPPPPQQQQQQPHQQASAKPAPRMRQSTPSTAKPAQKRSKPLAPAAAKEHTLKGSGKARARSPRTKEQADTGPSQAGTLPAQLETQSTLQQELDAVLFSDGDKEPLAEPQQKAKPAAKRPKPTPAVLPQFLRAPIGQLRPAASVKPGAKPAAAQAAPVPALAASTIAPTTAADAAAGPFKPDDGRVQRTTQPQPDVSDTHAMPGSQASEPGLPATNSNAGGRAAPAAQEQRNSSASSSSTSSSGTSSSSSGSSSSSSSDDSSSEEEVNKCSDDESAGIEQF